MRGPIPNREKKPVIAARLRASPRTGIVRPVDDGRWRTWLLWTLLLSVVVVMATALWVGVDIWPPSLQTRTLSSAFQAVFHRLERNDAPHTPHLVFADAKASINQPIPLSIGLIDSANDEIVVLSGLIEGTSLSIGTPLTSTRWSLPGRDLYKAFISAPENFEGDMDVTVTLYSSKQDILETKQARFEWSHSGKADKLPVTIAPGQRLSR